MDEIMRWGRESSFRATREANETALLTVAAPTGNFEMMKELLTQEPRITAANVDAVNDHGRTALMILVSNYTIIPKADFKNCFQYLMGEGANVNHVNIHGRTALTEAICEGSKERIKLLRDNGAVLNLRNVDAVDEYGRTALMTLVSNYTKIPKGDFETCFQLLLDNGADVNVVDEHGNTALIEAVCEGSTERMGLLIESGADVDFENSLGWTAVMHAASKGQNECLEILLAAGANASLPNNEGWTCIMCASKNGHAACLSTLLNHSGGVGVNSTDFQGWTALMLAAQEGHVDCMIALAHNGASPYGRNKEKETAVDIAISCGHTEFADSLLAIMDANANQNIGADAPGSKKHENSD